MNTSIIGRAMAKGLLTLTTLNIREHSVRGDGRIDDYPYGGGAGMVMQAEPVCRTYEVLSQQAWLPPAAHLSDPAGKGIQSADGEGICTGKGSRLSVRPL